MHPPPTHVFISVTFPYHGRRYLKLLIMEEDYLKTVFRDSYICVESLTKMYFAVTLVCIFHQGRFYISLSPLILEYHTVEPEH